MHNGGLLLELDTSEGANWLREPQPRTFFLTNIGLGASIKDRSYQVIAQFVPVEFNPEDTNQIQQFKTSNSLKHISILKAKWIKRIKDRKLYQRVATCQGHSTL